MPSDWPQRTLGDVSVCNTDTYSPKEQWPFVNYLDTGNITKGQIETIQHINSDDELPSRARRKVRPGDIVYSTVRPNQCHYGIISEPCENMLASTGFVVLRGIDGVSDTRFLYYYLTQKQVVEYLHSIGENSTSAYPSVKPSDIQALTFNLPPLPTQRRIASILGSLDDKIELNRRMNRTLERMAQALFKSWFVDFDPVKAKAAGDPTAGGLPAHLAALFPDRLVDSELGPIPEGWEVKSLDEVAHYLNGLACQKHPPVEGRKSLPVIKIRELRGGITANSDRASADVAPKYIVEDGDILFSWSGSLLVSIWCNGRGVLNQHVFKVTSEKYPKWYFYHGTKHHLEEFQRIAADKATTMGHIKRHHLTDAKLAVPPDDLLNAATDILSIAIDRRINALRQARTLSMLRDTLLPKLLSGELEVPEAKAAVEEAV